MNVDPKDDLDRAIDEALASMIGGEPRRVSAASVRQAMGESRGSRLPMWLAAAAVLIAALGVVFRTVRAPGNELPVPVARSAEAPSPSEGRPVPASSPTPGAPSARAAAATSTRGVRTTTEPAYEGLPRLTIASIELPEPLSAGLLDAGPIRIPHIEIAPLSVSSLSTESENK